MSFLYVTAVSYTHLKDILQSKISENDMAFLVYIADNIASGADRRSDEEEQAKGFDKACLLYTSNWAIP